jgi:2-octaprenyl-6-methoxyphenol hydroxylase
MLDVVVAGGGPVGAALALSLCDSGLDVKVVDPAARSGETPREALRPVALSHASRLILERCGVFHSAAGTPIEIVHVSQSGRFGRTLIDRAELGLPALGYVFNLGTLSRSLTEHLGERSIGGRVTSWRGDRDGIDVRVENGGAAQDLRARLLVIADGGQQAGEDLGVRDYGQSAIVAAVRTDEAPRGRAWERFSNDGPLALLPYDDRYALIWTVAHHQAEALMALGTEDFIDALQKAFGRRLGRFVEAGPRSRFPLHLRFRNDPVAGERSLIVGNAAQSLHPVAGQGLNLGLRDAYELAELLRAVPRAEIGDGPFLERYRHRRVRDRRATIGVTDSLIHLFSAEDIVLTHLRGAGLAALDVLPPLRRSFARRMVYGLRGLP